MTNNVLFSSTQRSNICKGYEFLSISKNIGKSICKNTSKNLNVEYSKKLLDHAKQSVTDTFKTSSKKVFQKTAEVTGDLIDNKIANKITKISKNSQQNNSETVTNEHDKDKPKERHTSLEERQKIIDDLRLI